MKQSVNLKECEELMVNFAEKKNMTPSEMLSGFQTALLNIAAWICECYEYSDDEYEAFMRRYADNVAQAVEDYFRKE